MVHRLTPTLRRVAFIFQVKIKWYASNIVPLGMPSLLGAFNQNLEAFNQNYCFLKNTILWTKLEFQIKIKRCILIPYYIFFHSLVSFRTILNAVFLGFTIYFCCPCYMSLWSNEQGPPNIDLTDRKPSCGSFHIAFLFPNWRTRWSPCKAGKFNYGVKKT